MRVEFADDLRPTLEHHESALQIQSRYMPAGEIEERYLDRPFGNAYDFGQEDGLVVV
jgi:hypothetical protein